MVILHLSRDEVSALLQLMDAGVKAIGRPAARACAVLDEKIAQAIAEADANKGKAANGATDHVIQ
jgi:hypothetical protein